MVKDSVNGQQVQTGYGENGARPNGPAAPLPEKEARDGDEHHVEAGDEAGLAGGGVDQSDLLHRGPAEQGQTGQGPAAQEKAGAGILTACISTGPDE